MRFKVLSAALLTGAMALASSAGPAAAATPADPSTVTIRDIYDGVQAVGSVASPNARCVSDRTVEIYAVKADGPQLFDVAVTSRRGYWSGGGPKLTTNVSAVRVKVLAKRVGPKGNQRLCKADTDSVQPE